MIDKLIGVGGIIFWGIVVLTVLIVVKVYITPDKNKENEWH